VTAASDNVYPKIKVSEGTAWATPASGFGVVYEKTDGLLYFKNDAGTEYDLTGSGTASASVVIFDEGVNKGTATAGINFVGAGVSGTVTSGTAVVTIAGPGYEYVHTQGTASVNCAGTTIATAGTILSSGTVALNGTTAVMVSAWFDTQVQTGVAPQFHIHLFDNGTALARLSVMQNPAGSAVMRGPFKGEYRYTPTATDHAWEIRGHVSPSGTATAVMGSGGSGTAAPGFIRVVSV
jgi:hypothetical protein